VKAPAVVSTLKDGDDDMAKALLILDAQNICPVGSREVPGAGVGVGDLPSRSGQEVAVPLLSVARAVLRHGGRVFGARDARERVAQLCVRGTDGAQLNPRLRLPKATVLLSPSDGGARFLDYRDPGGRSLRDHLRGFGPSEVLVGGLTTGGAFEAAVAEVAQASYPAVVLADAVFALDAGPGEKPSMAGFAARGARIVSTGQAILELYGWRDEYPAPAGLSPELYPPGRDTWSQEERPRGFRRMLGRLAPLRREGFEPPHR
jgi:nicotinamidase-related amidase